MEFVLLLKLKPHAFKEDKDNINDTPTKWMEKESYHLVNVTAFFESLVTSYRKYWGKGCVFRVELLMRIFRKADAFATHLNSP